MKGMIALLTAIWMTVAGAFEVERVFRPEIYGRGDANVRPQQPIDTASWVWMPGHDVWGGAVFSATRTDAATLAKQPQAFFRLRRDFEAVDDGGKASGTVTLPTGLDGTFEWKGTCLPIVAGRNVIDL